MSEEQPSSVANEQQPADPSPSNTEAASKQTFAQPIIAIPDRRFFMKRLIIAGVVLGTACWFLYDGFVKYPAQNKRFDDVKAQLDAANAAHDYDRAGTLDHDLKEIGAKHTDFDMLLQRIIGIALIPVGLFLLAKFIRESKGELKLEDDTVHVPGHPPVPIRSIVAVNNVRWDKKGVALFDYKLDDGTTGRFKIDDFIFIRPPTDAIHDEILAKMPKA